MSSICSRVQVSRPHLACTLPLMTAYSPLRHWGPSAFSKAATRPPSSATLRQAAVEFRASAVDTVIAQRMGTTVDDRRVKLIAAVWSALLMTALRELTDDLAALVPIDIDDVVAVFEATYAEFAGEITRLGQPA